MSNDRIVNACSAVLERIAVSLDQSKAIEDCLLMKCFLLRFQESFADESVESVNCATQTGTAVKAEGPDTDQVPSVGNAKALPIERQVLGLTETRIAREESDESWSVGRGTVLTSSGESKDYLSKTSLINQTKTAIAREQSDDSGPMSNVPVRTIPPSLQTKSYTFVNGETPDRDPSEKRNHVIQKNIVKTLTEVAREESDAKGIMGKGGVVLRQPAAPPQPVIFEQA